MKITVKSLFLAILLCVPVLALLFLTMFSAQAWAGTPTTDDGVQAVRGWTMGACRIPYSASTTGVVNFKYGEIIDMPLHINKANDSPDNKDIFIDLSGTPDPRFLRRVDMGESRYTSGGTDKYETVMSSFEGGIYFDQPDSNITDEAAVQRTIDRFRDSTAVDYRFYPDGTANIPDLSYDSKRSAVQLEFYVQGSVGKVRITNNCTVRSCKRSADDRTWDFKVTPGSGGNSFERYYIYAYHYGPNDVSCPSGQKQPPIVADIEGTYVSQTFGSYTSEPGGQIYVDGDVIIGGDSATDPNQVVKGKITVVATGNIWIGDNIIVDGPHDATGMPASDNPNVLSLISQGVIKVIDPGISGYGVNSSNGYPGPPPSANGYTIADINAANCLRHTYKPVGNGSGTNRTLPDPTVVEAAITVGGGGLGAENVARGSYGGRKENPAGAMDNLVVRGAISEVVRGVVGMPSSNDGYNKNYYYDRRLCPVPPVCSEPIPGDLNGDCKVDFEDVAIMAAHWIEKGYVRIYSYNLDTLPNWAMGGQWGFGQPTGSGGNENGNPDPTGGHTGSNVYGVNLNGDYTVAVGGPYCLTAGPFNCKQFYDTKLRFARWLNTDEPNYVTSKIEASNDGTNWNTLWENTTAVTNNNWQVVEYDVSATADNEATVYFRWSYEILNDRAYPYSGWNVDDIELLGKMSHPRAGCTTLDYLGSIGTWATGLDGSRIVGGYWYWDGSTLGNTRGFLYNGTSWTNLDMPGAFDTYITGIDGNNIVGYYDYSIDDNNDGIIDGFQDGGGFLYNGTSWTTLNMADSNSTFILGINGNNIFGTYGGHGFLYDGTSCTTLDVPGARETYITGISGSNIVGSYYDGDYHGFSYSGTTWATLDMPGIRNTHISGISGNNIVGYYNNGVSDYTPHGFLYDGTSWTTLDMPGAQYTWIYGINGNDIVGDYVDASGDHGFIYTIPASPPVCSEPIPNDLNGDCIVDFKDFAIMASHWLQRSYAMIANFDLDTNPGWTTQGQWQFGTPMGMGGLSQGYPDPNAAYTGQNVYGVNLNGDYTVAVGGPYQLTAGPFDCNEYIHVELHFARWLNTDTSYYVECMVEVSNDGINWQAIWVNPIDTEIADNQWQQQSFNISNIAKRQPTVYLRWSYQILSDRSFPYSGWNIDDVEIRGLID